MSLTLVRSTEIEPAMGGSVVYAAMRLEYANVPETQPSQGDNRHVAGASI
ncbi:hypothetical protein IU487_22550 [Nocardia puris]|nr:hypothetical protein [Nocardia puris]MBF6213802.1 hypothetical protein [Nocardia puris]